MWVPGIFFIIPPDFPGSRPIHPLSCSSETALFTVFIGDSAGIAGRSTGVLFNSIRSSQFFGKGSPKWGGGEVEKNGRDWSSGPGDKTGFFHSFQINYNSLLKSKDYISRRMCRSGRRRKREGGRGRETGREKAKAPDNFFLQNKWR